ncbi:hypothetical protein [Aeromonas piscicola]|uniref:hypothetical protein n=1 Tax=Aeromonas piscicola TaxID=600645 RepID=UPI0021F8A0FA|nr:hypothetical protein [Aeromonas piscicola]MCW0506286.1 hypothetical protein [Aeromonas piscicola]
MAFTLQSYLAPLPDIVLQNYHSKVEPFRWQNKKIIFAPHCELVFNLVYRGFFVGFDILGALDKNIAKHGKFGNGLQIFCYDDLRDINPDMVIVANTRYHDEITLELTSISHEFLVIDLCAGYSHRAFRKELSKELDCRNIAKLRPGCINVPDCLTPDINMKVEIVVETGWGLGDKICAMSAAREFARKNPNLTVHYNTLPNIVKAYDDSLLHLGAGAYPLPENYALFHREKDSSPAGNYLGSYYLGLGMDFDELPRIELPEVPLLPGLISEKYIALQPTANWAQPNLTHKQLQMIIERCPVPVVLAGAYIPVNATSKISDEVQSSYNKNGCLAGSDSSYIGDEITMLSIIRHAALVLAPRSASAHIAAGYGVKSVIWVPSDGENWHLSYPDWEHRRVSIAQPDIVCRILDEVISLLSDESVITKAQGEK